MTRLAPSQVPAAIQQAMALHQTGDIAAAKAKYEAVLDVQPAEPNTLLNYSTLLVQQGELTAAEKLLTRLTLRHPKIPYGHFAHGNVLRKLERWEAALAAYSRAAKLEPTHAGFHFNRATALDALNRWEEAAQSYAQAIARNPDYAEAYANRAHALNHTERYRDALADAERAIALDPANPLAYTIRGNAQMGLRQFAQARADYDHAITMRPDDAKAWWNKALLALTLGEYEQGWDHFEWRWEATVHKREAHRFSDQPWNGEPLAGKTILVHPEQGLGDFIQFFRYIPLLAARGAHILLETPPVLLPLLAPNAAGLNVTFLTPGEPFPPFDYYCPIMSLARGFHTTLSTIPSPEGYLTAAEPERRAWREKLGAKTQPRIGLVWSGAAGHLNDHNRSIALSNFAPLLCLPYEFHSLQKEVRERDQKPARALQQHSDALTSFADTAALIEAMDLVISVDTSVAHLAGALGKKTLLLLPYAADYRWLLDRADSPWYATITLFRQTEPRRWDEPIAALADALTNMETT